MALSAKFLIPTPASALFSYRETLLFCRLPPAVLVLERSVLASLRIFKSDHFQSCEEHPTINMFQEIVHSFMGSQSFPIVSRSTKCQGRCAWVQFTENPRLEKAACSHFFELRDFEGRVCGPEILAIINIGAVQCWVKLRGFCLFPNLFTLFFWAL